jgi:hypothetical protein
MEEDCGIITEDVPERKSKVSLYLEITSYCKICNQIDLYVKKVAYLLDVKER